MESVAGRECGSCIECCRFIPIKTELLEKPTNQLCPYCTIGSGCRVYEKRPSVCSGWNCGWRYLSTMSEEFRPDKSGIVIRVESLPEITVTIIDRKKMLLTEAFASLLARSIRHRSIFTA